MIRVLHLITSLSTGGAEMMLYKLISRSDRTSFEHGVVSLTSFDPIGPRLEALGIPVTALGLRPGIPNPLGILRVAREIRQYRPHLVQTWIHQADLMGSLAARMTGRVPVIWNIRHSTMDPDNTKQMTIWTAKTCARLSRFLPVRIVCCSEASRVTHGDIGYATDKMILIPNGFDLDAFHPDPLARESVRMELDVSESTPLIGLVGRFHAQKDHPTFVKAAARLKKTSTAHFVLCGRDVEWQNRELNRLIMAEGLSDRFHLLGQRDDLPRLTAAFDLAVSSSSFGEGFPNVVGEAMACAVPCVVTDVGDSAFIVGETGRVTPPRDPEALASAWLSLLTMDPYERQRLGKVARQRVESEFSLPKITTVYENLYREVAALTQERELSCAV